MSPLLCASEVFSVCVAFRIMIMTFFFIIIKQNEKTTGIKSCTCMFMLWLNIDCYTIRFKGTESFKNNLCRRPSQ